MKITTLIKELKAQKKIHGDIEVFLYDDVYGDLTIDNIDYSNFAREHEGCQEGIILHP